VLFCPGFPSYEYSLESQLDSSLPGQWPYVAVPNLNGNRRISYQWMPHWIKLQTGVVTPSGGGWIHASWRKLSQIPKNRVLCMDITQGNGAISHDDAKSGPSWNLLFRDGSVHTVTSKLPLITMAKRNPDVLTMGDATTPGSAAQATATWFDDTRDIIETIAEGGNPNAKPLFGRVQHPLVPLNKH
jgi:hypothetical protein